MNRTSFNAALELQISKNTQFCIQLLNGSVDFVKVEDLGTKGTVHVISKDGNRYRAIEKLLSFYEVPGDFGDSMNPEIRKDAVILVDGQEEKYDADTHFWIAPKAMWVSINANKEAQAPFTAGIRIQISSDLVDFLNTDVRAAVMNIAGKIGKAKVDGLSKVQIKEGSFGLTKVMQHGDKTVEISIDSLAIKKATTYILRRFDDMAAAIGFFMSTGVVEKFKAETKELEVFMKAREDHLGK